MPGDGRYLTFRSETQLYALPAGEVSEVVKVLSLAKVPQAPKSLLGLANLRGAVMPVASMRGLLGREDTTGTTTARLIVLDGATPVAIAVDAVAALVTVARSAVQADEAGLSASQGEHLRGAFEVNGEVAKIVDVQELLTRAYPRDAMKRGASVGKAARIETVDTARQIQRRLVTFVVAAQEYALDLDSVREIVNLPERITSIPKSDDAVLGVMAYRDGLLPLLSLRILLGLPAAVDERSKVVVTMVGGTHVGLVADGTRSLFPVEPERVEPAPPVLKARAGGEARIAEIYRAAQGQLISILVPDQLFREDIMKRLVETVHEAGSDSGGVVARESELRFLAFRLSDSEFALPIDSVEEVARVPEQIMRLPKTPKFLEGVVNLRGTVLPVVDQRRRFDMPAIEKTAGRRLVVVRSEKHRAGLIVDSVTEVLRCPTDAIQPSPDLTGEAHGLVRSVINLEQAGRMLLLLDPSELLTRAERSLLDSFENAAGSKEPRQPPA